MVPCRDTPSGYMYLRKIMFGGNNSPNSQAMQILRSKFLTHTSCQENVCYRKQRLFSRHLSKQSQNMPVWTVLGYLCLKSLYWYVMVAIFWLREHSFSYLQEFLLCSFPINIPSPQMRSPAQNSQAMPNCLESWSFNRTEIIPKAGITVVYRTVSSEW